MKKKRVQPTINVDLHKALKLRAVKKGKALINLMPEDIFPRREKKKPFRFTI